MGYGHDRLGVLHEKCDESNSEKFVVVSFVERANDAPVKRVDHLSKHIGIELSFI